ncbi:MAG: glutaredoxin [Spirochaetales bacterium]|nr:glutaredoxin [Spirochaetales bacterium]
MQIIGTAKCRETKKCRLWFDQRGISYHFVDLKKRDLSPGELEALARGGGGWDALIDDQGKAWQKKQLAWKEYNPQEELMEDNSLLRTPVVREGKEVIVGAQPDAWKKLALSLK